ncbi:ABC transporter ATP-binding protein [Comamonas faecalis]|uniref:ABC transporter ATP-binding protein n=1 Tax=Comamonas faecalis TaxID=1387849 RepID=A0ABP7S355_9BURK
MNLPTHVAAAPGAPALAVQGLTVSLQGKGRSANILNDVSFEVQQGETVCLVGESGCGKSMTALAIMRLLTDPLHVRAGRITLDGRNLLQLDERRMRGMRGNQVSMIFQEPMTALNPVYTVGEQIGESLRLHQGMTRSQARSRAAELLQSVGIPAAETRVDSYPHEMSGGMRQRVMIAMALACDPRVLIADEPTTALDVTVQAQIFDLLRAQQQARGTAIVMITHDMGAVAEVADRVVVMYGGHVVEHGCTAEVLAAPRHPYTQGLIACMPELDDAPGPHRPELPEIAGIVPSVWQRGAGCPFADRCPRAMPQCHADMPPQFAQGPTQRVACWLYKEAP